MVTYIVVANTYNSPGTSIYNYSSGYIGLVFNFEIIKTFESKNVFVFLYDNLKIILVFEYIQFLISKS